MSPVRLGRIPLLILLLGLLAGGGSEAQPAAEKTKTPRVVILVSLDTLRADHLGSYGYPRPTSPVIDAVAREGVLFEDANSTAPWTVPAHASMLTGLYPIRHGASRTDRGLGAEIPTLATLLADAGFTTAAVVNSFRVSAKFGLDRGFEHTLYVPEALHRMGPSAFVTKQAIRWLKRFRNERLFIFMHYFDIHSAYTSFPKYEEQFVSEYRGPADGSVRHLFRYQVSAELAAACRADPTLERCRAELDDPEFWSQPRPELRVGDVDHLIDLYDANLRQTDNELGRLIDFLKSESLLDESLLIVTSDHGEEFLDHGSVAHGRTQFQELLQVPLILRGPGLPPATRVGTPVSLIDVVPTVLATLGIAVPGELDGMDLSPLWRADATRVESESVENRVLFAEASHTPGFGDRLQAARRGRYKLIYDREAGESRLYDLELDPGEHENLADRNAAVAKVLRDLLLRRSEASDVGEAVELSEEDARLLRGLGYAQ